MQFNKKLLKDLCGFEENNSLKNFTFLSKRSLAFIKVVCLDPPAYEDIEAIREKPLWKKALDMFWGVEADPSQALSKEEEELLASKMISIEEEKWPAIMVNIGGIAMCCAGVFLFGFYA